MSLRSRLVASTLGLLALGLLIALGATWAALQDTRRDLSHDVLDRTAQTLTSRLEARSAAGRRVTDSPTQDSDVEAVWGAMASRGEVPSYFSVRTVDGEVRSTSRGRVAPDVPEDLLPAEPTSDDTEGVRWATVPSAGGGPDWLLRVSRIDTGDVLVVGTSTQQSDELLSRTASVALLSSLGATVAIALLSWRVVSSGLRPLETIAATATEINAGDLTRRLEAPLKPDTEVGRLTLSLNAMLGQIERAFADRAASERRLRRFVADASHELRTPVATIRGHAELFRRGGAARPDDLSKILRRIESEAERMGTLVDELLLLARLDQGRALERRPVHLDELAVEAVAAAQARQPGRTVEVCVEPVVVMGDGHRLRQVLDNLLANLLTYTPVESPSSVRVIAQDGNALVEVADSGPGLDEAEASRVFDRFYRTDAARAVPHGGTGLGLSIVAAVAQAHDGSVEVHPTPGGGTTFAFRMPLAPGDYDRGGHPRQVAPSRPPTGSLRSAG